MPETAAAYLRSVADAIDELPGKFEPAPIIRIRPDEEEHGLLRINRRFDNGSRLAMSLYVHVTGTEHIWLRYTMHLMDSQDGCIFRYDNASHHGQLTSHPHHKHEGRHEDVRPSEQPRIEAVIAEIRRRLQPGG